MDPSAPAFRVFAPHPPSPRGEREVQAALNAWLAGGAHCRGPLGPMPAERVPGTT